MSSISTKVPHVLIVGGGLGGPALAQALRKQGITFDIFERDNSDMSRAQGWAVLLNEESIDMFNRAFSDDLDPIETVDQLYEHGIPSEFAMYDLSNGEVKQTTRMGTLHGQKMIRANRARLRSWLMSNIPIRWNKRFQRYEEDEEGVTAYFEDGTSYRGDVLVGADGINSRVRNQLLPDPSLRPQLVATSVIVGEVTATEEQYQRWLNLGASLFVGYASDDRRLVIAMKGIADDKKSARYYWMFGWKDAHASNKGYWTEKASRQELHDYVVSHLDGLDMGFTEPMRATPVEEMLQPPLRLSDMVPPELPRGRVTLLGDAIHPMTPFRGQGANIAMTDGLTLSKVLTAHRDDHISDLLKVYEAEMRPRGAENVLSSRTAWYEGNSK